jgi:hypothetical protein
MDHPLYHHMHGKEHGSPYVSSDLFSLCARVYGAPSLQLVQRGSQKYEKTTDQVQEWWIETVRIWFYFGILFPREGPNFSLTGRVGYTFPTGSENQEVGQPHGMACGRSHR